MRLLSLSVFVFAIALVVHFAPTAARAADDSGKTTTISGVLIDQACAGKMMEKDDPEKAAADHPRSCAMKDACAKSGYGVVTGKKLVKFDENGNKLAKEYLEKSKADKDLKVKVEGTQHGEQMDVTSIKDAG